jgi:hypothetical protein
MAVSTGTDRYGATFCSTRVLPLALPTAHAVLLPATAIPARLLTRVAGADTTLQAVPSQCSMSVPGMSW